MPKASYGNRLLAVGDQPVFGDLIKKVAESSGFKVVVTDQPGSFAKAARLFRPTVMILDLNMPGTDGIQLLRQLAADQCTAHVILSSGADGRMVESAMRLGQERGLKMSGMLPKPVRVKTLREMLNGLRHGFPKERLTNDLVDAIGDGQLFLEYQPKLDCSLGYFTGVEALVRWRHPIHGLIRPDEFVPLAEETNLISQVTDWVIVAAAKQSAVWHADNIDLQIAVNISAKDAEDLDLPERLHQHCQDAGIEPASLTLELTERGAMREAVQMMEVLPRLCLRRFRLSIDDFGTGYSSLVQLQRLPFSEIKIDHSFVLHMNMDNSCRTIVEIVIGLARQLGLKSVAEGVEDGVTLNALIGMGCDLAQGYYMSRPVAADRIPALVLARRDAGRGGRHDIQFGL